MNVVHLQKALAFIASGLVEKEKLLKESPNRYPYSKNLQRGINMFLAACLEMGRLGENTFKYADESSFLTQYISKPICEWFDDWDQAALVQYEINLQPFYAYGPFAYHRGKNNVYITTEECVEFLSTQENNIIEGTDERALYEKIIQLFFDHFIRKLSDAYAACHETSYGQNEIFGFLQTRFQDQQKYLPSALCGNLFGMKKNEQGDIILFRQFAFGRSLMKDLPYLRLDENGEAIGPHVIMLSGSSWAEGSYEYHINRPVNYILEADSDKRDFLSKTKFYESGFSERVSGSGEMRIEMLKKITEKSAGDIIEEYNRNVGKILIIVNSYEQASIVQETLANTLHKKQCSARVYRMISDATTTDDSEGVIRRGEANRFASMPAEILIAPAMAIERGHNIVDEKGHSALGAVFFFVRPMSVPDDVQEKGSKLNGYMEAHCKRNPGESIWEYNMRMRQEASKRWSIVTRSGNYGLDNLSDDDKKDIVSTLFILILQIFGRLARVTDTSKPAPHVYFVDGAFRKAPDTERGFDCLTELGTYLDNMIQSETSSEIANTLYKPFYDAFKKGVNYGR